MIRVIGVLKCLEKLSKSMRSAAVFGWATSLTRHASLLKRVVSQQDFFEKKLVLPAVSEIVLVPQLCSHRPDQLAERGLVFICNLAFLPGQNELMKVGVSSTPLPPVRCGEDCEA